MKQIDTDIKNYILRVFTYTFISIAGALLLFYFLAGDQLHYRASRGIIPLSEPESAVVELTSDHVIEQEFTARIQRIKDLDITFGTYYRTNNSDVTVELIDTISGNVILSDTFKSSEVKDDEPLHLHAETPIENLWGAPLKIRLTSNAKEGNGLAVMKSTATVENVKLYVDGKPEEGQLAFSLSGEDYIWLGLHYIQFSIATVLLLGAALSYIYYRFLTGKRSYIVSALLALRRYKFLISQIVGRDFKRKYRRSVLGILWSFLNPLMMMLVQYFVFSTVFRSNIPYFPVYLMSGNICFQFFNEAIGLTLLSIIDNANLIKKVYIPKYIYPFTRVLSSMINLGISLLLLIIVFLLSGLHFTKATVLALYFIGCLIIFSFGLGLLMASAMVFFRDVQFLWGVLSMVWMYATPIFYPDTIIPDKYRIILTVNPLYHFIKNARTCIIDGISPEPRNYVITLFFSLVMLLVGSYVFKKNQDNFILYL